MFSIAPMRWLAMLLVTSTSLCGLTVKVDYRYDTSGFFNNPEARNAMEAVALRCSRIIDESLAAVSSVDDDTDRRFLFLNPATGEDVEVSSAASVSTDALVAAGAPVADEYWGEITLPANEWILFVGARDLSFLAAGGSFGGGTNFSTVFNEGNNLLNRGFNSGLGSLTVLGGNIAFDVNENWHFNHLQTPPEGAVDFYSIALHELGHCFGLAATGVAEWRNLLVGDEYFGANAIMVYEIDTGTEVSFLPISRGGSNFDYHWKDGQIFSKIFPLGQPNYIATVGPDALQEVLMAKQVQFTRNAGRKELTNVDVAALEDLGWSVITADPVGSESLPVNISMNGSGELELQFESIPGVEYKVQTSVDSNTWADVTPSVTGGEGSTIWRARDPAYTDPNHLLSSSGLGFFRVVVLPVPAESGGHLRRGKK